LIQDHVKCAAGRFHERDRPIDAHDALVTIAPFFLNAQSSGSWKICIAKAKTPLDDALRSVQPWPRQARYFATMLRDIA